MYPKIKATYNLLKRREYLILSSGRFYAFEKAHHLDPSHKGRGVSKFLTALQRRLERDSDSTLRGRVKRNDSREMKSFLQHCHKKYIQEVLEDPSIVNK
jgi:hypothetical protein